MKHVQIATIVVAIMVVGLCGWKWLELSELEQKMEKDNQLLTQSAIRNEADINEIKQQLEINDTVPCNFDNCVFYRSDTTEPVGIATVQGHYSQERHEMTLGDEFYEADCDVFTVSGGSDVFQSAYVQDPADPIVINLDYLTPQERDRLQASTPQAPVSLMLLNVTVEAGTGLCLTPHWAVRLMEER